MTLKIYFYLLISTTLLSCLNHTRNNKADNLSTLKDSTANSSKSISRKKFIDPDNTAVFTTKFVIADNKEITEVHHDKEDSAWQFFSDDKFEDFSKVAKLVGLGQITKIDSTLFEIADLSVGYVAHRKFKGDKWVIKKSDR